ncbi:hypothetical protein [Polyangium aurulentum]|uniref:hypothetical protein n=1 Tax=Polyangium aurulentum TaxID=2567896 RepID=UPI0010AE4C09|nr:hypothetical protein [Polyangium aurulentum]UQA57403.1 hypothetical protein E8A73_039960 [Polyangium aurulentum]
MKIQIGKKMALVAMGGLVAGLAACGGGATPEPETQAAPATEAGGEKASCSQKGGCKSNGQCGGHKEAAPPADGAAAPAPAAPADAPK